MEPILSHDFNSKMIKKLDKIHVNHSECANNARQLILGRGNRLTEIKEEDNETETK